MGVTVIEVEVERVEPFLESVSKAVYGAGSRLLDKYTSLAYKTLTTPAGEPKYPIKWDSVRQRKAFFATGGFGGGIPYRRTGKYVGAFRYVREGDSVSIATSYPKAVYIGGDAYGRRYSRIHVGNWPGIYETVNYYAEQLTRSLVDAIGDIVSSYSV